MTIVLGQLVLHSVRFTTPSLQVDVTTPHDVPQLSPSAGPVAWPSGTPVDDAATSPTTTSQPNERTS